MKATVKRFASALFSVLLLATCTYSTWATTAEISPQESLPAAASASPQFLDVKAMIVKNYATAASNIYGVQIYIGATIPAETVQIRIYKSSSTSFGGHYAAVDTSQATYSPGGMFGAGYYIGPAHSYTTVSSSSNTSFAISTVERGFSSSPRYIGSVKG